MKKTKSVIVKIAVVVLVISAIFNLLGGLFMPINASTETKNMKLQYENMKLRKEYVELQEKLKELEAKAAEIQEYDNMLYSQVLGVDYDTTSFYQYGNDSAIFAFKNADSMFIEVDERALYAAEMLAMQLVKLQDVSIQFKNNKNAINYYPTISPIKTKDFIRISSAYGWREHPIEKQMLFHEGIDISAIIGTPIYSTAQGRVVKVMYSKYSYGNRIVIKHAYGFETLYAHLHTINVKKGQWIRKNQLIGSVGNSGKSTGPHLHYEIHKYGKTCDPLGYFYTHITDELLAMQ